MALTKVNNRMIDGSYLNVKDFGATGDGSTDDSNAIQDAINHACADANGIQTVFFPDGHYIYDTLYTDFAQTITATASQTSFTFDFYAEDVNDITVWVDSRSNTPETPSSFTAKTDPRDGFTITLSAKTAGQIVHVRSNSRRHGKIRFLGTGSMTVGDLKAMQRSGGSLDVDLYGTVLESTGAGLRVSAEGNGSTMAGTPVRKFHAEGITFIAENATQVIEAHGCPIFRMKDCAVKQLGEDVSGTITGNGLYITSAWFFDVEHTVFVGPTTNSYPYPAPTPNNCIGIRASTYTLGGLWSYRASHIDVWTTGFKWEGGEFLNVIFRDSALQNFGDYAIHGSSGNLRQLTLDNTYFENVNVTGTSYVKGDSAVISKLVAKSCFFMSGTNSSGVAGAKITGPHIDLGEPESVNLEDNRIFRPPTSFLKVNGIQSSADSVGVARNNSFFHDATDFTALTTPIYMFETVSGVPLPSLENNTYSGFDNGVNASSTFRLYDTSTAELHSGVDKNTGITTIGKLSLGEPQVLTGQGSAIYPDARISTTFYDITNTTAISVFLPAGNLVPDGRVYCIKNNSSSAGDIFVKSTTATGTNIKTVAPDESAFFILDKHGANTYLLMGHMGAGGSATAIEDGDFTSNGLMKRTGAGSYTSVTDNSSNWNTAYGWGDHSTQNYAVTTGDTFTGNITIDNSDPRLTLDDSTTNTNGVIRYDSGNLVVASDYTNSDAGSELHLQVDSNEEIRIDGLNRVAIGNVTYNGNGGVTIDSGFSGALTSRFSFNRVFTSGTDSTVMRFRDNGQPFGDITYSRSGTAYNVSSDERLKENIVDAPSASNDIDGIRVRSFDWKQTDYHQKYGTIAQELINVCPFAVREAQDEDDMMAVDYSKLVPMMIKEIQELRARVAELEASS